MKVGDKVLCIKSMDYGYSHQGDKVLYNKNSLYKIAWMNDKVVNVICFDNRYLTFNIVSINNYGDLFSECFIDIKENRKLKLEKINESNL